MNAWMKDAAIRYEACNRATLTWILDRHDPREFLETKVNPLTGVDYDTSWGLRGPDFTYGWIQGRGLEALVTFANFYRGNDLALSDRLFERARGLYQTLAKLFARDGRIYFLYDANLNPIRTVAGGFRPQAITTSVFSYSDAFVAKGLVAAASHFAKEREGQYLDYLSDVIAAIVEDRFQLDEACALSPERAAAEPRDFGPRMILLGAAGLLQRCGHADRTSFADSFIDYVLGQHHDAATGLLLNVPGEDACNVGHGIEFCGFAFEHLTDRPDDPRIGILVEILRTSLEAGLQGPGIALTVSAKTGRAISSYYPWWPLPEAIRAAALGWKLSDNDSLIDLWQRADAAFFTNYWQPELNFAYQTRSIDGPVDYVPATPDLDPGYHTGLGLLAAIRAIRG